MTSHLSQSSVATVVEDIVSDRNIGLKVCMIVLNCLQILSSWIAVCYFFSNIQEWTPMEIGVSGSFLIVGNYIIPGIANGIIYWRRWNRSTVANRRRMQEENKQAWVCLRIALSLLGIPTVGRYIETIMVSRKLDELEKKHLGNSVINHKEGSQLNAVGNSRLGSIINQKNYQKMNRNSGNPSMISGSSVHIEESASQQYAANGMNETSQDKVRRARRQYKRCEHDGSQMALIAGAAGAGPMALALAVLYLQRIEKINMQADQGAAVITSAILNVLWLSATLTHFYPARHILSEAEFERGVGNSHIGSIVLLYLSHLIQVVLRIICLAIFANWYYYYVLVFVFFHWLVGTIIIIAYRVSMKAKTVGQPRITGSTFLSAFFLGYVGIFDFVNGNEGKTRLRYLIYYAFYYLENVAMLVIWVIVNPLTQIRYPVPFVCVILGLFWLGFLLLQLYLYYYSDSPYGSSVIGCCCKNHERRTSTKYVEEVRDPVFGVPLSQSAVPLWQQHPQKGDVGNASRISGMTNPNSKYNRPIPLNHNKTPSIMSIPSAKTPTSILSQPTLNLNMRNEKPKVNPALKAPPVLEQKSKKENAKPPSKRDFSSDSSSSSSEEFQKFTPKPIRDSQSHPDLLSPISSSNSSTIPVDESLTSDIPVRGQFRADPSHLSSSPHGSKSVDNIAYMVPAIQPNKNTRPIGGGPRPISGQGQRKPHSQDRSRNPHRRNPQKPSSHRNMR